MCKLCNSDSPLILSSKQPINHIVKDYIGTFPCSICAQALFKTQRYNPNKSLDDIILTKLYIRYRGFTHQQLGAKAHHASQLKCIMGVQPVRNRSTGIIVYKAYVACYNPRRNEYLGTFSTLSEAVNAKVHYMQLHGHTKGLTQLTNKLKELSCN